MSTTVKLIDVQPGQVFKGKGTESLLLKLRKCSMLEDWEADQEFFVVLSAPDDIRATGPFKFDSSEIGEVFYDDPDCEVELVSLEEL